MRVELDGERACARDFGNHKVIGRTNQWVYLADPWYAAANANVRNVKITAFSGKKVAHGAVVISVPNRTTPRKGHKVFTKKSLYPPYEAEFTIKVTGTRRSNVFLFGTNKNRGLGVYVTPKKTSLSIHIATVCTFLHHELDMFFCFCRKRTELPSLILQTCQPSNGSMYQSKSRNFQLLYFDGRQVVSGGNVILDENDGRSAFSGTISFFEQCGEGALMLGGLDDASFQEKEF